MRCDTIPRGLPSCVHGIAGKSPEAWSLPDRVRTRDSHHAASQDLSPRRPVDSRRSAEAGGGLCSRQSGRSVRSWDGAGVSTVSTVRPRVGARSRLNPAGRSQGRSWGPRYDDLPREPSDAGRKDDFEAVRESAARSVSATSLLDASSRRLSSTSLLDVSSRRLFSTSLLDVVYARI